MPNLDSIASLYANEQSRLKRLLVLKGVPVQGAADAVQEAFIRLLRAPRDDIKNLRSYLQRTAKNVAIDQRRREMRAAAVIDPQAELDEQAADDSPLADSVVIAREELACLDAAILELSPRCREVLVLHRFEGMSYAEIAETLGISKNTVMVHMVKALGCLKKRLGEHGGS